MPTALPTLYIPTALPTLYTPTALPTLYTPTALPTALAAKAKPPWTSAMLFVLGRQQSSPNTSPKSPTSLVDGPGIYRLTALAKYSSDYEGSVFKGRRPGVFHARWYVQTKSLSTALQKIISSYASVSLSVGCRRRSVAQLTLVVTFHRYLMYCGLIGGTKSNTRMVKNPT